MHEDTHTRPPLLVVAYGGGLNSSALLVGLHERGLRPDRICFADTGGEKPDTYAFLWHFQRWLETVGFPALTVVVNAGQHRTLEMNCLATKTLPSKAYGWSSCSDRYKLEPQRKWLHHDPEVQAAWGRGERVRKAIGIDAGESHRAKPPDFEQKFTLWYPLIEWGWDRDDCAAALTRQHLPIPPKSACFFCPSSRKSEVLALARTHPDLFDRAVAIEAAGLTTATTVKGLGRHWAWADLVHADRAQFVLFPETTEELPCGCFDGDDEYLKLTRLCPHPRGNV